MGLSTANALRESAARLLPKMLIAHISRRPRNVPFQHQRGRVPPLPHFQMSRKFTTPSVRLSVSTTSGTRAPHQTDRDGTSHNEPALYERRPDWYIRLIPLLIVLDLAMLYVLAPVPPKFPHNAHRNILVPSANFAELVINHWAEPVVVRCVH